MVVLLTALFSPVKHRVGNSEKIDCLKKKLEKTFEIIKWSEMELKKFNLKFARSKPNFYAKYVKLVLKA